MISKTLFIVFQYLIPQHALSRLVGYFAASETPWIKNTFITRFAAKYQINMAEAREENPTAYASFNAFFTRALKDGMRPVDPAADALVSPADGAISQLGAIKQGRIFQAKGRDYSVTELLGGDAQLAEQFNDGHFMTVYLSPRDYHRVHMPITGKLVKTIYVPGDLFSVNPTTAQNVPALFARNERLVCIFDTPVGQVASVMVGAMIVAGIETVWSGQVCPLPKKPQTVEFNGTEILLEKGAEMGRFKLGSTVVLCLPKGSVNFNTDLAEDSVLRMGEKIGTLRIA